MQMADGGAGVSAADVIQQPPIMLPAPETRLLPMPDTVAPRNLQVMRDTRC